MDPEKILELLEKQQADLDTELEKLGLGDLDNFDESKQWEGYPEIVRVCYEAPDADLTNQLQKLIADGADVNAKSPWGETAVSQCFMRNAFDALRLLVKSGADISEFDWSEGHLAIVMGEVPEVAAGSPDLILRNAGGRSLFLQACRFGNLPAAQYLEPITPAEGKYVEPDGEGPVMTAAVSGSTEMLSWLLTQGYDVNECDKYGGTALLDAVEQGELALAEILLNHGADVTLGRNISRQNAEAPTDGQSAFSKAANLIMQGTAKLMPNMMEMDDTIMTPANSAQGADMIRLLARHGAPLEEFEADDIAVATGADRIPETVITPEMFNKQATPRAGIANPEHVEIAFWTEQIRTGRSGYAAEVDCLGERKNHCAGMPVWSFDRFGRSATALPDGRWILIAGEHEDHYDPDFCIYADVTVIHRDARVDHFIYPETVFPPTDFHTATYLDDHILLIGNLGYAGQRPEGETQVLRLNLGDFSIHRVETTGQNPGWISRHKASLVDGSILVSGGKIEPGYVDNTGIFALDLATMVWSRAS